jgi:hypothetical protein
MGDLINEIERKKDFIAQIKGMIHNTNFQVGSHERNFQRKPVATAADPGYQRVVLSPRPHKNVSTLKIKYAPGGAFARDELHSKTIDVNRMEAETLAMT